MRQSSRRIAAALAAAAVASTAVACSGASAEPSAEQQVTLQFASYLGPLMAESQALQWAFDEINERSDGSVTIDPVWRAACSPAPTS